MLQTDDIRGEIAKQTGGAPRPSEWVPRSLNISNLGPQIEIVGYFGPVTTQSRTGSVWRECHRRGSARCLRWLREGRRGSVLRRKVLPKGEHVRRIGLTRRGFSPCARDRRPITSAAGTFPVVGTQKAAQIQVDSRRMSILREMSRMPCWGANR